MKTKEVVIALCSRSRVGVVNVRVVELFDKCGIFLSLTSPKGDTYLDSSPLVDYLLNRKSQRSEKILNFEGQILDGRRGVCSRSRSV